MKKKLTTVPFQGTEEQKAKLDAVIEKYRGTQGAMMPVLQQAQDIYGYLPIEVQKMVAEGMDVSLEEIYGIVSFYSQFALNPKGKYAVAVCLGTACYVRGSQAVFDKVCEDLGIGGGDVTLDGKFSVEATRCVGCCGLAPVMTINEDVYGKITADDVPGILAKYKA
ncbi:MAG: NAD(P)H-dependent oxidoreductase subunit E [Ruminococcaceae bacterium]|nr:NAD(P)H-dependent oxidoreductase subunit E [Oscillospiraceae bacterium]